MIPKLSIIIPNYNHGNYLTQRIQSVLDQTFTDFELIILDDCSTDDSLNIIELFKTIDKRIEFHPSLSNSGNTFEQWDKGIKLAKSDLIWIAESDDFCSSDFVEKTIRKLLIDNSIAISFCQSTIVDENGLHLISDLNFTEDLDPVLFKNNFIMNGTSFIEKFLIHRNVLPNASAVIFRKSIYDKIEYLAGKLKSNGDYLIWLKLLCFGNVAFEAMPLNYFRRHNKSVIAMLINEKRSDLFQEQFDLKMRLLFDVFIKAKRFNLSPKCISLNRYYISLDKGNKGLFLLYNKYFIKGIWLIIQATFYPKIQSGFLKKALRII